MGLEDPPGPRQGKTAQPRHSVVKGLKQAGRIDILEFHVREIQVSMNHGPRSLGGRKGGQEHLPTGLFLLEAA